MSGLEKESINDGEGLLIHIGLPKCASSWLQEKLFVKELDFFSDMTTPGPGPKTSVRLMRQLLPLDSPYFNKQEAHNYFMKHLIFPAFEKGMIPVFSRERLSGLQIGGCFDRVMIAERLHSLFPKGKILIIIREQNDLIRSLYAQYIKGGGTSTLNRFLTQKWLSPYIPMHNLEQHNFYKLVSLYTELFGEERVLFLPYELFKESPSEFVLRITKFSGSGKVVNSTLWKEKINPTPSESNLALRRRFNRIAVGRRGWINQNALIYSQKVRMVWPFLVLPKPIDKRIARKMKNEIDDYVKGSFEESNRELQKRTDINLAGLGYKM